MIDADGARKVCPVEEILAMGNISLAFRWLHKQVKIAPDGADRDENVIVFEKVTKSFRAYQHLCGIKQVLFGGPKVWRAVGQGRFTCLHEVSFTVKAGEGLGIYGRNGAGKSTTLALIAGVLQPCAGQVKVRGRVVPLLQLGAGFHPDLTGRENILLNGMLLGMSRSEVSAREAAIMDFAELDSFIDEPIRTYSSGMLARLGFAVAVHADPEILLLDEILAVGDVQFRAKCYARMELLRNSGVTMVLVSHQPQDIIQFCDRVLVIEDHRIVQEGAPAAVFAKDADQ